MRPCLRLFIPLLAITACLSENGAFDGQTSSGAGSTSAPLDPTSGPGSSSSSSSASTSSTATDPTSTGTGSATGSSSEALTGTATSDTTSDATTDATTEASTGTSGDTSGGMTTGEPVDEPTLCGKLPGAWKIGGPKKLGMPVNMPKGDLDMWLSEPGMVLMWSSYREGKLDTYRATRKSFGGPFDQAFNNNADIGLSTPGEDTKIALSSAENRAYIAVKMPADAGHRLYTGDRQDVSYAPLTQVPLVFPGYPDVVDPHISTDDLRLYYAATKEGDQKLVVATRPGPDLPFMPSSAAPFVNVDEPDRIESDPTLPAHELVVIYARSGDLAETGIDIYYAQRASLSDPFGAPQKLPAVNSDLHDMSPHLSRDGCELFFIRGTDQDPLDWDIYRSEIQ